MDNLQSSTWRGRRLAKPLTPAQLDSFRPKPVGVKSLLAKDALLKLLGPAAGIPAPVAKRLAEIIINLEERITALENAQRPVALAGVETR